MHAESRTPAVGTGSVEGLGSVAEVFIQSHAPEHVSTASVQVLSHPP